MALKSLFIHKRFTGNKDIKLIDTESIIKNLKSFSLNGANSFFLQSLRSVSNLDIVFGIQEANEKIINFEYNIIIIDIKSILNLTNDISFELLVEKLKKTNAKKVMYCCVDSNFTWFKETNTFDFFDFSSIYVTNLLKDYDQYKINGHLKDKLKPTYLGLGNLGVCFNVKNKTFSKIKKDLNKTNFIYDAFFAGANSNNRRLRKFFLKKFNHIINLKIRIYISTHTIINLP